MTLTLKPASAALAIAALATPIAGASDVKAQVQYEPIPKFLTTPDEVESTRLGTLTFKDGYPTGDTAQRVQDELDYLHGIETFMNTIQVVSMHGFYKGFLDIGVGHNEVLLFEELMDAHSLFLTANADTPYFLSFIDLSDGPMVVETPPNVLGIFDDMWFRWVIDFGFPGPDRGEGGRYLLVPPGYDGVLPEGGYYVAHSRTNRVFMLGRAFLEDNDPKPPMDAVKEYTKIYPYVPGGIGTSIGSFLLGEAPIAGVTTEHPSPRFVNGTGMSFNTIPPNDFTHYEWLDEVIQMEPASATDPELAGQAAAIGIVKGEEFNPDERMRRILDEAVAVGNAGARTLGMGAHPRDHFRYYDEDSTWWASLWEGGYDFMNPPGVVEDGEIKPVEDKGARKYHSRTSWFYTATGVTPAMIMRLENIGSQYLIANVDTDGNPFDGAKTYKLDLPPNIPAARFWSMTVYDNQSRGMLQTSQRYPRAGSQTYPSPAAEENADGSTTIYFSPKQPEGVARGNWIETDPKKGWFTFLRLYFPEKPFFNKTWRPGEIELVK